MRLDSIIYLVLSSGLIGLLSAWLFSVLTYAVVRRMAVVRRHFPSDFWLGVGVAPVIIGISFFGFSVGSGWLSVGGWLVDHCPLHQGHTHLCLTHIAQSPPGGFVFWLALGSGGSWMACQAVRLHFSSRRLFVQLCEASQPNDEFHLLPSKIAAAFTTGLLFPRVYLTTRTVELLQPAEREAVLVHERAHVGRRDPLRSLILAWSEKCFPGMALIRGRWQLAVETECDRATVQVGFSRTLVAKTILKLKRANQDPLAQATVLHYGSADDDALRTRLELLLNDTVNDTWVKTLWILLPIFWLLSVLFFTDVHHGMETLLGWLS